MLNRRSSLLGKSQFKNSNVLKILLKKKKKKCLIIVLLKFTLIDSLIFASYLNDFWAGFASEVYIYVSLFLVTLPRGYLKERL